MTLEEQTIHFLETQIEQNYKDLCSKYLIESVEWIEDDDKDEIRPFAHLVEEEKLSNIVLLFPPFDKSKLT